MSSPLHFNTLLFLSAKRQILKYHTARPPAAQGSVFRKYVLGICFWNGTTGSRFSQKNRMYSGLPNSSLVRSSCGAGAGTGLRCPVAGPAAPLSSASSRSTACLRSFGVRALFLGAALRVFLLRLSTNARSFLRVLSVQRGTVCSSEFSSASPLESNTFEVPDNDPKNCLQSIFRDLCLQLVSVNELKKIHKIQLRRTHSTLVEVLQVDGEVAVPVGGERPGRLRDDIHQLHRHLVWRVRHQPVNVRAQLLFCFRAEFSALGFPCARLTRGGHLLNGRRADESGRLWRRLRVTQRLQTVLVLPWFIVWTTGPRGGRCGGVATGTLLSDNAIIYLEKVHSTRQTFDQCNF